MLCYWVIWAEYHKQCMLYSLMHILSLIQTNRNTELQKRGTVIFRAPNTHFFLFVSEGTLCPSNRQLKGILFLLLADRSAGWKAESQCEHLPEAVSQVSAECDRITQHKYHRYGALASCHLMSWWRCVKTAMFQSCKRLVLRLHLNNIS